MTKEQQLMKGYAIQKRAGKIIFPVVVEHKHDEIRAHLKIRCSPDGSELLWDVVSYAGKPLANCHHMFEDLAKVAYNLRYLEVDCGFEVNGNYDDSYRYVRSTTGVPDDLQNAAIKIYVYDLPENQNGYVKRLPYINELVFRANNRRLLGQGFEYFTVQRLGIIETVEELDAHLESMFQGALDNGYEGLMLKTTHGVYERKRSKYVIKVKPEDHADGKIVGMQEAVSLKGEPLGRVGSLQVVLEDGSTASIPGIKHELATELWVNRDQYIGKQWLEFKYMERDRQGGYRHPRFFRLREEK